MATTDDENIYDTHGTVLYCTVPVIPDGAEPSTHDLSDALNVPLDYETALAMLEVEHAHACAATGDGRGGVSGGGRLQSGGAAFTTHTAGRASFTAADGHLSAVAASALGASNLLPTQPQQRAGLPNMSARYGTYGGVQRTGANVSFKDGPTSGGTTAGAAGLRQQQQPLKSTTSSVGGQSRRDSHLVGFGNTSGLSFETVAARNAYVAKAAHARGAGPATPSLRRSLNNLNGTSTSAATAARPTGGRALTVADAMEMLFPITSVGDNDDSNKEDDFENAKEDGEQARNTSTTSSSTVVGGGKSGGAEKQRSSDATAQPPQADDLLRLWRRADVGHVSRLDVVLLYLHLQHRCATESARPRGVVCPNRERLYGEALQELTRQITLLCPERGLLLDELARSMQQSMETYDVLLDSASQYAVRKSTERDLHQHLFAEKAELETEVRRREHRVSEWRAKYAGLQKRLAEQQAADAKLHEQEIAYAKKANAQLVNEIKRLASEAERAKEN